MLDRMTNGVPERPSPPIARRSGALWPRAWRAACSELQGLWLRLLLVDLLMRLLPPLSLQRVRTALYRFAGIPIGPRSLIAGRLELQGPGPFLSRLTVGSDCWLNSRIFVDLCGRVAIGNHVEIGHHVVIVTSNHAIGPARHRTGAMEPAEVVVEDGVWVGACVTLLPGARVGAGSVIGAGSLVVGAIPPGVLAVGRPARVLRRLEDPGPSHEEEMTG
jgi:maltose O-acetyltransferase